MTKSFEKGSVAVSLAKVLMQTTPNVRLTSKRILVGPGEIFLIPFSSGMLPMQCSILVLKRDRPIAAAP